MWFYWSKARTQQLKTADLSRGESVRVTARAASAHAMLQVSCVHVYMCTRALSLYVRGPLSCTAPCGFRALTYAR